MPLRSQQGTLAVSLPASLILLLKERTLKKVFFPLRTGLYGRLKNPGSKLFSSHLGKAAVACVCPSREAWPSALARTLAAALRATAWLHSCPWGLHLLSPLSFSS